MDEDIYYVLYTSDLTDFGGCRMKKRQELILKYIADIYKVFHIQFVDNRDQGSRYHLTHIIIRQRNNDIQTFAQEKSCTIIHF